MRSRDKRLPRPRVSATSQNPPNSAAEPIVIQDAGWIGGRHRMVKPLSNDLRRRVVAAVSKGESCRAVASRFGVAVSSVVK